MHADHEQGENRCLPASHGDSLWLCPRAPKECCDLSVPRVTLLTRGSVGRSASDDQAAEASLGSTYSGAASMFTERHVVGNRVFLLALDHLYLDAIKRHEREELLSCAREVASALSITADVLPVEGYYADDPELAEYFSLVRTLQQVDERRRSKVARLPAFRRLDQVMSAPLYGHPERKGHLLPVGRDALSKALMSQPSHWTIEILTTAARAAAQETADISLVGLAALTQDPVVLTALRESVVLYAELGEFMALREPQVEWQVDEVLAERGGRFVEAFNTLFNERLPAPTADKAAVYWHAYEDVDVVGRCVRLGFDDTREPIRYYHWAICPESNGLTVREFWHPEVWTTARYRAALAVNDRPDL